MCQMNVVATNTNADTLLCTDEEIFHLMKSINTSKSSGSDGISGRMLKATAASIAELITKLFKYYTKMLPVADT